MKKDELIHHLAEATGLKQKQIRSVLSAITETAEQQIAEQGEFKIHGLVNFKTLDRKGRYFRNPHTGEQNWKDGWTTVNAKPWKNLKDAVG